MRILEALARACAILAGGLLSVMALLTCVSVLGRNFFAASLAGDFELTGVAAGISIALCLPLCQLRRGNIAIDFFTAHASPRTRAGLDRAGSLLLAGVLLLLAWRTVLGGLNAWDNHSGSMLLGFPDWIVYFGMVPALVLTAVIALCQSHGEAP